MTHLRLQNSELNLTVLPPNGGGIISFGGFGEAILKPAPDAVMSPTDPAAFVMLPYCNRIAFGRAEFGATSLQLAPTLAGERHALHGEGWLSKWDVETREETNAELSFAHKPTAGKWPWAFEAKQRYELSGNRLTHAVRIQNTSGCPMPAGLGFHPYFLHEAGDGFSAHVTGRWGVGDGLLPVSHEDIGPEAYWPGGQLSPDKALDHCFTGWNRMLTIVRKNIRINLTASPELSLLHLYAPPGEDFFCAEPVSHMPNALNQVGDPHPMLVLQPGEVFKASVSYLVEKL